MSYEEAYAAAWDDGPAGALEFLKAIFHAPENQKIQGKPSDYLSDGDDEYVSPAYAFDRMMRQFATRWMQPDELLEFIEGCLLESRSTAADQLHRAQPFNAVVAFVGTYGHGDASVRSVHVSDAQWKMQYGFNHQLVGEEDNYDPETEDDETTYDFIYELEHGDRYAIRYDGARIEGELLFRHVRLAQYGVFMQAFMRELFGRQAIADFPKSLPFRLFITADSTYNSSSSTANWFPVGEITEESLQGHPLQAAHLKSAEPPPELTTTEKWEYLLTTMATPDSSEFQQLADLIAEHDDLRDKTLLLAQREFGGEVPDDLTTAANAVPRAISGVSWARLFWRLPESMHGIAEAYVGALFSEPLPTFDDLEIDEVLQVGWVALSRQRSIWNEVPEQSRGALLAAFEAADARANAHPHPVMRVLTMEQQLRAEHGDDAVVISRHGVEYELDTIPEDYVQRVGECLSLMPPEFPGYMGIWDFVMNRLEALGDRAAQLAPSVVDLMNRYCGATRSSEHELKKFATILFKMGLESPPELVRTHCERSQYHMIDFYKEWAIRLPKRRWEEFVERFENNAESFASPDTWDALLVDSKAANELFAAGILESEHADAMIARLCESSASDRVKVLINAVATKADSGRHTPHDEVSTERVITLLKALPAIDDDESTMLRRAQLLRVRFAIDRKETPTAQIDALLQDYPDHPMLLFFQAELAERDFGPEAAGRQTIHAIQKLSADDLVYRKAFFEYTGVPSADWQAARPVHGYTAFRWALDHLRADAYRAGEYKDGQASMDRDPFYRGFEQRASKLDEDGRANARDEAARELEFGDEFLRSTPQELAERLTPESWNITSQIAARLVQHPDEFTPQLLRVYDWFHDDEIRRKALVAMFWPVVELQDPLLAHPAFQQDLAWFIRRYPGLSSRDLARDLFSRLNATGDHRLVLDTAKSLPAGIVQAVFRAIEPAFASLEAWDEGIELIKTMRDDVTDKKPEYVLLTTNIAVVQFRAGDIAASEATFDELFAMDWSRFDYDPSSRDAFMDEILGGDLDAQIADVFRQYYASARFNAACVWAVTGRHDDAIDALREANTLHGAHFTAAMFDAETDLEPIRETSAYRTLIAEIGGQP